MKKKLHIITVLATVAGSGLFSQAIAQEGIPSGAIGSGIIRAIEAPESAPQALSANANQLPPIIQGKHSATPEALPPIVQGKSSLGNAAMALMPKPQMMPKSSRVLSPQFPPIVSADQAKESAVPIIKPSRPLQQQASQITESPALPANDAMQTAAAEPIGQDSMLAPISVMAKEPAGESKFLKKVQYSGPAQRIARAFSPSRMPVMQGSSTRNIGGEITSSPVPPVISGTMNAPAMNMMPQAPSVPSGSQYIGGPEMMAPNYASSAPMPTYFDSPPVTSSVIPSPIVGGCTDCGSTSGNVYDGGCSDCGGNSISGCQSCGPGGCYDARKINTNAGTFGSVSSARRYLNAEFMYLTREDGDITNSNFGGLGDFSAEMGWRFTLGQRSDAVRGTELTYFGAQPFEERRSQTDAFGRLNSLFSTGGGFTGIETSTFFNATEQSQFKDTVLHSLEFNKVRWGWDVLKTFVGWRYFHMEDDYVMTSTNGFGNGTFRLDTANYLIGPHVGAELFYDIGYRWSFSVLGKYGAHINFNQADTFLNNAGLTFLDSDTESVTLSTSAEVGLLAHYQFSPNMRMRAGYTGLFLGNLATVSDNFTTGLSPLSGFDGRDADDTFFHGFSVGLEIYR